jgi:DNA-binding LytR/AlgR family response regulator
MDGMNGMELARKIRGCDSEVTIIFVTSSIDYALQGYDVNALHYLIKPLNSSVLEQLISADYRKKFQNDFLCFKSGTKSLRISFGDIIRVETTGRRVTITLQDEDVYYPGKLSELLEELPQREFVRCHQAFAINLRNTKELTRQSAIAANGVETPISRTYAKDTQKAFLRYIRDN